MIIERRNDVVITLAIEDDVVAKARTDAAMKAKLIATICADVTERLEEYLARPSAEPK